MRRNLECNLDPTGAACLQCHDAKLRCSMMPRRPTGMPNRQHLTPKFVFEFRLERHKEMSCKKMSKPTAADKRGKKRVRKHQEGPQPKAPGSGPSPSTSLMLSRMSLASGSSKGDSPPPADADIQPSLPDHFSGEVPLTPVDLLSRTIVPPFQQHRQPSPAALLQSTDDGQNLIARVLALEARMARYEESRMAGR